METAEHADRIHVQAVLPAAVKSNIFEAAGGVDDGDVGAAEGQRTAMLDIKAEAMDPVEAARVVFEQAAAGEFYLLTQPEYVGNAMSERAAVLAERRAPALRTKQRFDPSNQ